jgi:hypothetical protein
MSNVRIDWWKERIWKEVIIAEFEVLSQHLPGRTKEYKYELSQDGRSPGRDLNPGPLKREAWVPAILGSNITGLNKEKMHYLAYCVFHCPSRLFIDSENLLFHR